MNEHLYNYIDGEMSHCLRDVQMTIEITSTIQLS